MTSKNGNINFCVGRVLMGFLFIFLVSFSNNDSNTEVDSNSFIPEQVDGIDNDSSVLVEPVTFPTNSLLGNSQAFDFNSRSSSVDLRILNSRINVQFRTEALRFCQLRPNILKRQLTQTIFSSPEDHHSISSKNNINIIS